MYSRKWHQRDNKSEHTQQGASIGATSFTGEILKKCTQANGESETNQTEPNRTESQWDCMQTNTFAFRTAQLKTRERNSYAWYERMNMMWLWFTQWCNQRAHKQLNNRSRCRFVCVVVNWREFSFRALKDSAKNVLFFFLNALLQSHTENQC